MMKTLLGFKFPTVLLAVTLLVCKETVLAQRNAACQLPVSPGFCFKNFTRYYFDSATETCNAFAFSGCGGNMNRFLEMSDCINTCVPTCKMPPDVGPCKESHPNYYYDRDRRKCRPLNYGGCKGNTNRFNTLEECAAECRCTAPKDPGPCKLISLKYYFDHTTRTCQEFDYGGCRGNGNRFESLMECEQLCDPQTAAKKARLAKELKQKEQEKQQLELLKQQEQLLKQRQQQQLMQQQQQQETFLQSDWQSSYPRRQQLFDQFSSDPLRSWNDGAQLSSVDVRENPQSQLPAWDRQMEQGPMESRMQRGRRRLANRQAPIRNFEQVNIPFSRWDRQDFRSRSERPFWQTGVDRLLQQQPQDRRQSTFNFPQRDAQGTLRQGQSFPTDSDFFSGMRPPIQRPRSTTLNIGRSFQPNPSRSRERCQWTTNGRMCFTRS